MQNTPTCYTILLIIFEEQARENVSHGTFYFIQVCYFVAKFVNLEIATYHSWRPQSRSLLRNSPSDSRGKENAFGDP